MLRKSCFTLVEILVALVLIAFTAGIIAINLRDLISSQAFLDNANLLLGELRLAEDLMTIMNVDVEVEIKKEGDHFTSQIVARSTPPNLGKRAILSSKNQLMGIERIEFEDLYSDTVLTDAFNLTFFSRGFTMNHGTLKLIPKRSSDSLMILLPGHPAPLSLEPFSNKRPDLATEMDFMERMTNLTFQETSSLSGNNETENET